MVLVRPLSQELQVSCLFKSGPEGFFDKLPEVVERLLRSQLVDGEWLPAVVIFRKKFGGHLVEQVDLPFLVEHDVGQRSLPVKLPVYFQLRFHAPQFAAQGLVLEQEFDL